MRRLFLGFIIGVFVAGVMSPGVAQATTVRAHGRG
jgi:hypothetical protein